MKRLLFYLPVFLLYLAVPFLIISSVNALVSLKYEVEEKNVIVAKDNSLTNEQKIIVEKALMEKGKSLRIKSYTLLGGAILAFCIATILLARKLKKKLKPKS